MPVHLAIGIGLTLGAIATATAVVCERITRVERATWRVAVVDREILTAVQHYRDAAPFN